MARGRLISRSLGSSRKFAELGGNAGKLGEFAQALFPLVVVVTDDFGRLQGDAASIKWVAWPSSPRPIKDFEAALAVMQQVNLIQRYQVNGCAYLAIIGFDDHQSGLHKRSKSRFPEPPADSGKFPILPVQEEEEEKRKGKARPRFVPMTSGRSGTLRCRHWPTSRQSPPSGSSTLERVSPNIRVGSGG